MIPIVLQTKSLNRSFGAVQVTSSVDFVLKKGERHALIGPNGAGKTTFVNLLTGTLRPSEGRIFLHGAEVTHLSASRRVKKGLARTFQINQLFGSLSIKENVCLAVREALGIGSHFILNANRSALVAHRVTELLDHLGLRSDMNRPIYQLPYGKQRLVEIAIALGLEPSILILDEPAAGVAGEETELVIRALEGLSPDLTLLLIEHDMALVKRIAHSISVLVRGKITMSGSPEEVLSDPRLHELYLGTRRRPHA